MTNECWKDKYTTRKKARVAARSAGKKYSMKMFAYKCDRCENSYHITKFSRKEAKDFAEKRHLGKEKKNIKKFVYIICILCINAGPALASADAARGHQTVLPMTVKLIQCGNAADMVETCAKEPKCCVFIEPAAGEAMEDNTCEIYAGRGVDFAVCTKTED